MNPREQPLPLVCFQGFKFADVFSNGTGETKCGRLRIAVVIKGCSQCRAFSFQFLVRLTGRNAGYPHRHASWR